MLARNATAHLGDADTLDTLQAYRTSLSLSMCILPAPGVMFPGLRLIVHVPQGTPGIRKSSPVTLNVNAVLSA